MKTLFLCLILGATATGQEASDLFDKAPPAIDQALRARIAEFYKLYEAGQFKQAFTMVADDAQDAFFASGKENYKDCQTARINYAENFSKATVVETCKSVWMFHGQSVPTTVPVTTNWKAIDGQWYWYFVKPTFVRSPFSPTGVVPLPPDAPAGTTAVVIPKDPAAEARNILARVSVDKNTVALRADRDSKDQVRVLNDMPGSVSVDLGPSPISGLKIKASKVDLNAGESAVIEFEYNPNNNDIACSDCAKRIESETTFEIRIVPTAQLFPITIKFTDQEHRQYDLPKQ